MMNGGGASTFNTQIALDLVPLAQLAASSPDLTNLFLPPGWDMLALITHPGRTFSFPRVKGFLAKGRLGGASKSSVVMALGVDWADWLTDYIQGAFDGLPLTCIQGAWPGQVALPYNLAYCAVRDSVWASLRFLNSMSVTVTGIGLGGPLAQLATLDLIVGRSNDDKSIPNQVSDVDCYVFSTAPVADDTIATYYASKNSRTYIVTAGTKDEKVDFFPLETSGDLCAVMGTPSPQAVNWPDYDVPWVERSGNLYISALGGIPTPPPKTASSVGSAQGFSRSRAYSFANLVAVAYQRFQHPDAQTLNISPFTVGPAVTVEGVNFCTLFTSVDSVAVAIRGTCTSQEFATYESNSSGQTFVLFDDSNINCHAGAVALYGTPTTSGASTTFAAALAEAIKSAAGGNKSVYFVGHSFGGAVATLAAIDTAAKGEIPVSGLYTFGSLPVGDTALAAKIGEFLANESFHLVRDSDPWPMITWPSFTPAPTQIAVTGTPADDDYPFHSIRSYAQLIDPSG